MSNPIASQSTITDSQGYDSAVSLQLIDRARQKNPTISNSNVNASFSAQLQDLRPKHPRMLRIIAKKAS